MPLHQEQTVASPGVSAPPPLGSSQQEEIGPIAIEACRRLDVEGPVRELIRIVRATYPAAGRIDVGVFHDEDGAEKIRVSAKVNEEGEDEARKYLACLEEWSSRRVNTEQAEKVLFFTS